VPATSQILGKRRLAVEHADGWTTLRDVLEALEAVEAVPLPARCGFRAFGGGVAVEVVVREFSAAARQAIAGSLERHGVPVRSLRLVEHRRELEHPLPLRCDLRDAAFQPPPFRAEIARATDPAGLAR
jgi:hypothetical protein